MPLITRRFQNNGLEEVEIGAFDYLQACEIVKIIGPLLGYQEKHRITVCYCVKEVENRGVTILVFTWKKVQVAIFAFGQEPGPPRYKILISRLVAVLWRQQFNTE